MGNEKTLNGLVKLDRAISERIRKERPEGGDRFRMLRMQYCVLRRAKKLLKSATIDQVLESKKILG